MLNVKVGDKVRVINADILAKDMKIGQIGTVVQLPCKETEERFMFMFREENGNEFPQVLFKDYAHDYVEAVE